MTIVYLNQDKQNEIWKLPKRSRDLWFYIAFKMSEKKQTVNLVPERIMEELKIKSPKTFRTSLAELIKAKLLKRISIYVYEVNNEYYVCDNSDNPHFNGTGIVTGIKSYRK
jgi:hypothetical protein